MRFVLISSSDRPRPLVFTPAKGSQGDRTIEAQAEFQSVDYILKQYGGNLREMAGWQTRGVYGDAPVDNLEDAFDVLRAAHDDYVNNPEMPFPTMEDALRAMADGTFIQTVREFNNRQKKDPPKKPDEGEQKPVPKED